MINISKPDFFRVCANAITAANSAISPEQAEKMSTEAYGEMIPKHDGAFDRMLMEGYTVLLSQPIQTSSYQGSLSNEDLVFLLPKAGFTYYLERLAQKAGANRQIAGQIAQELVDALDQPGFGY